MLSNLQMLRAFAAFNVVLFHIIQISSESGFGVPALDFLNSWGANGVDIFFVISGFIMVYISDLRPKTPIDFLKNRAIRIVPIYWVLTLLGVAAVLLAGEFRGDPVTWNVISESFLFLTRWTGTEMPILYVGWTLEWEMLFYLIFSVSLLMQTKFEQFLLPLLILSVLVAFMGQNPIILEFGFGMIIAKLAKLGRVAKLANVLAASGAALLLATIWVSPDLPQPVLWGLPSALLVLGLVNMKQYRFRLGEYLGGASYSIYLIQVFTIPVFYKVAEKIVPNMSTLALATGCLIGTAIAGCVCYEFIEKTMHAFIMRKRTSARVWERRLRVKSQNKALSGYKIGDSQFTSGLKSPNVSL